MLPKDNTGVKESDTQVTGDGSDGAAGQSREVEGLKAAVKAEREKRQSVESKLARLEGTVEGLKSGQQSTKTEPAKIYTRAELRALVESKQITEDQMDVVLENQLEAKLRGEIEAKTSKAARQSKREAEISAGLVAYAEAHPDLLDPESEIRKKVQREYDYLVELGDDQNDRATELKAVRAAIGALAPTGRKKTPESHQETGGAGDEQTGASGNDWSAGLTLNAKQKAHYQKAIDRGIYKGAEGQRQLQAELKSFRKASH